MRKLKEQLHSNRIKIILKEQGINQKQLSLLTKLNESHLSKIILGQRRCISLPVAFLIANALNKKIEEVFIAKKEIKKVNNEEGA